MSVQADWAWSDQFLPEIYRILGAFLLVPTSLFVDRHQGADFYVFEVKGKPTFACRIRRAKYKSDPEHPEYQRQFTVRSARYISGNMTELEKIIDLEYCDYYLYGFQKAEGDLEIDPWYLLDLKALREHWIMHHWDRRNHLRFSVKINGDGTGFHAFDIDSFEGEPQLVIRSSFDVPTKPVRSEEQQAVLVHA